MLTYKHSLPEELVVLIVNACDIPTLLALRKTNRVLYGHVHHVLRNDRYQLLLHYVPNPEELWQCLDETCAVVGGMAALHFLLRSPTTLPPILDLYASSLHGERLEQLLEENLDLHLTAIERDADRLGRHVAKASTFTISAGRFITVHTSVSVSAFDPIAISPTTAMINWVSHHAFACAYPTLTLQHRALGPLAKQSDLTLLALYRHLDDLQFCVTSEPASWPEYGERVPPPLAEWRQPCLRQWFVCPSQGRFFGDAGSLLTLFDLLQADLVSMRQHQQPPFGITVAWRMSTSRRPCDGPCTFLDPLVPEGLLTVPALIVDRAFQLRAIYQVSR